MDGMIHSKWNELSLTTFNQSVSQAFDQSGIRSINRSINQAFDQSIGQSGIRSINRSINQTFD